jgi:asparagine synthase (glutamine-hydrolysing)
MAIRARERSSGIFRVSSPAITIRERAVAVMTVATSRAFNAQPPNQMTRPTLRGRFDAALSLSEQSLASSDPRPAHSAEADGLRLAIIGLPRFTGPLAASVAERGIAPALTAAYRAHGERMLDDVHGTFALALFDTSRNEALLAIDRIGIETLCFALDGGRLYFANDASEVAASLRGGHALDLATLGGLDPQGLYEYLYFHCIPGPSTVYRGVTRLLPGHALRFANGSATVSPYWSPSYQESHRGSLPTLEGEFLGTVKASVARAIEGASSPGAFLSGGTDSSTIAGMLGAVTGAPARTYSIGFDAEGFDEMQYARIAAKHFKTEHHEYYITPADLVASIPRIAATYDQPFGNSSVLPTYYCARMAEADGVDRMLGGDGGDELFGGNTRYAKQRVFDHFERAPDIVKSVMRTALAPSTWESVPVVRKARSYVHQASVPMPDRMQTYNLLMRIGVDRIFEPGFIAGVDVHRPMREMREWYARSDAKSLVNRMLAFDL